LKHTVLILFFCLAGLLAQGQQMQILSAADSLPVPFSTLIVKNKFISFGQTADDHGIVKYREGGVDSSYYTMIAQAVGFERYEKGVTGIELNQTEKIYLRPLTNLSEVVVTSQYEPTTAEKSVQKIQVIDKEKILQMGAVNMQDVLSNQLNVRLQMDNVLGAGMSLQGVSGENVKILLDGVPMIGRLNGNIDLSQINLNNVERIEFIEGPLSVQYGTNALAGTINIITKNSSTKKYILGVSGYYESIGTYNLHAEADVYYKKHNIQVSGGRNYFDGWNPADAQFFLPKVHIADSTRYKQWKPKEQYFASLGYNYTYKRLNFGFKSVSFHEKITNRGYPRAPYAENTFDDYYYTKRLDNHIFINGKLSDTWAVNALVAYNYYNRVKKTVYKDLTTLEETLSANSSDQDTSNFTLLMSRASFVHTKRDAKLNYEIGYDVNHESAFGKRITDQVQYMGDYAVFVTGEYKPWQKLILKPGLRYAYNTVYNTPLVPSFNMRWMLNSRHTLRASYARGFRAPTLKELYFVFVDINHDIVGNTNLSSEQSNNYSVAYNYKTSVEACRVKFDVNAFYNDINNLITLAQTTATEYSYVNIGRYKTLGMQFTNNLKFRRFSMQTGFNYTGRYNQLSETEDVPEYAFSPEILENLSYKFIRQKLTVSVFYKYNGKLPGFAIISGEVRQTALAAYHTMDATVSKLFYKDRIGMTLGCKNIFDVRNLSSTLVAGGAHSSSATSIPLSTGRNYFIKLSLNLTKE
jgi:outer membrane receptor for ferrienterochelin and colicins